MIKVVFLEPIMCLYIKIKDLSQVKQWLHNE